MPTQLDDDKAVVNPGQEYFDNEFNSIVNQPDMQALADQGNAIARDDLQGQESKPASLNKSDKAELDKLPGKQSSNGGFPYTPTVGKEARSLKGMLKNRKVLAGLGVGGGAGILIAIVLSILPLKFEALITNAATAAAKVPGYAVEQRTEYLVTRALATRVLMLANNGKDVDGQLVFCGNGSIACSLFSTYTSKFFSDEMDFDFTKRSDGKVTVSVKANGRQYLGGTAKSWDIVATRDWKSEGSLRSTIKTIENHSEMRSYIKNRVEKGMKNSNVIVRFVARKILMKKYGVHSWRAFENTRDNVTNKIDDIRSTFKAKMYQNTIGKISPRFAAYMACLQGGQACEKLLDSLSNGMTEPTKPVRQSGESDAEFAKREDAYNRAKKDFDALQRIASTISGEVPATASDNMLSSSFEKIFSSKILAVAGGVLTAVMVTDTVLTAVNSVNNGVLDEIGFDMASQQYTGFAFGDDSGVVTNWQKTKAGDFDGTTGSGVMNEIGSLVDCDGSALCAYESGYPMATATASITGSTASAASAGFQRECSTSDGTKTVTLAAGELVCPERKLYRNYAGLVTENEEFKAIAVVAGAWDASIHKIIEAVSGAVGAAVGFITGPIKQLLEPLTTAITKQLEPLITWFMDTVFNPPSVGYDTTPANNYDAMSGALHLSEWETMRNGVDSDGTVSGGGGTYLNEQQSQDIVAYQNMEDQEYYNSQSSFAKLFDTSLKGSLAQQVVLQMPQNGVQIAQLPAKALSMLFSSSSTTANAAVSVTSSAFGLPNYSYALNDPALTADPSIYTAEYCSASAAAREASLQKVDGVPVPVYTKSDPCALEKLVVGSLITDYAPTDPNAFKALGGTTLNTTNSTGSCPTGSVVAADITKGYWDGGYKDATFCAIENTVDSSLSSIRDADVFKANNDILQTNTTGKIVVQDKAAQDLVSLVQKYTSSGSKELSATFSYRSHNLQCVMYFYDHKLAKLPSECSGLSQTDAENIRSKMTGNYNMPGNFYESKHESGTAMDVVDLAWIDKCAQQNYDGNDSKYKANTCFNYLSDKTIPDDPHHVYWAGGS